MTDFIDVAKAIKEEEKDLVWLPKSLVKRFKEISEPTEQYKLINDYIEESKRDVKTNLDSLEDDLIQYKAQMLNARKKFEEAKKAELDANYALWEKLDEEKPKIREKVAQLISELEPLKREVQQINKAIGEVNTYQIEKLIELVDRLNISFGGQTGDILKFLFNNYKQQ